MTFQNTSQKLDEYATSSGKPLSESAGFMPLDVLEIILIGLQFDKITPNDAEQILQEGERLRKQR